ncbi:putative formamidopyrimidine-DNA glycosylase-like protein [bacterium BMS3Bbin02]|nr:putative formamidopyrimidine-DNA glycosylase-like protein [bacterium BMS3Bbin02]
MPELPEIEAYLHALDPRIMGATLENSRIRSFSVLKTVDPPIVAAHGATVSGLSRIGKRIVIETDCKIDLVIHLMVAGRFQWNDEPKPLPRKRGLAAFDFSTGSLMLTEAGSKQRARLHVVTHDTLADLDPGGLEVTTATLDEFAEGLLSERHTLKRALTDARYLSGIGGAFADEILFHAGLSPLQMNTNLDGEELERLYLAAVETLRKWTRIRIDEIGTGFPKNVTAFHPGMSVHGKYDTPCLVCGTSIQRISYAHRETNYCPMCQTGGRVLADRSLSRLLKDDWPTNVDELEG